jgi:hypothetical protein
MIVRMTRQQSNAVLKVGSDKLSPQQGGILVATFEENLTTASAHRVDVMMPACYWRELENVLFDTVYDVRGFKVRDISGPIVRGHRAIRAALNVRETHPALFGKGALGRMHEMIPVWKNDKYSVYPTHSAEFTILAPTAVEVGQGVVTKWVEAPQLVGTRLILTEATHVALYQ